METERTRRQLQRTGSLEEPHVVFPLAVIDVADTGGPGIAGVAGGIARGHADVVG